MTRGAQVVQTGSMIEPPASGSQTERLQPPEGQNWLRDWIGDIVAMLVVVLGGGLLLGRGGPFGGPGLLGFGHGQTPFSDGLGPPPGAGPEVSVTWGVGSVALLCGAAVLMGTRRRWPRSTFAAAFFGFMVAIALGTQIPALMIALTIAAYALAARVPRRYAFGAAGIAVAGVLVLSAWSADWQAFDQRLLTAAAAVAVAAALGDSARSRRDYLREVTERADRAEQTREAEARRRVSEERLRIARDLHDTVAHQISVMSLNAGVASSALQSSPERAEAALATIRSASRSVLSEIGELLRYLRAEDGIDGTAASPQPNLTQLGALIASLKEVGLTVDVGVEGDIDRVPDRTSRAAYRVVQEGLTNALKHGNGRRGRIEITVAANELRIAIENPVQTALDEGEDALRSESREWEAVGAGLGLIGVKERVAALGGTVEAGRVDAAPNEQFRLEALFPLDEPVPIQPGSQEEK